MNKRTLGLSLLLMVATACGGEDEDAICDDLRAKVRECNLDVDTSGTCRADRSEEIRCSAECLVGAACTDVTSPGDNDYYRCLAVCSGAGDDAFVCADGSAFVERRGVCDGVAQCPDASDEADCGGGDAGSPTGDAGL